MTIKERVNINERKPNSQLPIESVEMQKTMKNAQIEKSATVPAGWCN